MIKNAFLIFLFLSKTNISLGIIVDSGHKWSIHLDKFIVKNYLSGNKKLKCKSSSSYTDIKKSLDDTSDSRKRSEVLFEQKKEFASHLDESYGSYAHP